MEIWKDCVGYESLFQVSNMGRVWSKRSSRVLKTHTAKSGYVLLATNISGRDGRSVCLKIHRLVAEAFLTKPCEELVRECEKLHYKVVPVNHLDGNKANNAPENLEWCSYTDNSRHAVDSGLKVPSYGVDNGSNKLTPDQVKYIRKNHIPRHPEFGGRALARHFGVSHRSVQKILQDLVW